MDGIKGGLLNIEKEELLSEKQISDILKVISNDSEMKLSDFSLSEGEIKKNSNILKLILNELNFSLGEEFNNKYEYKRELVQSFTNEIKSKHHLIISIFNIIRDKRNIQKTNTTNKNPSKEEISKTAKELIPIFEGFKKAVSEDGEIKYKFKNSGKTFIAQNSQIILKSRLRNVCLVTEKELLKEIKPFLYDEKLINLWLVCIIEEFLENEDLSFNISKAAKEAKKAIQDKKEHISTQVKLTIDKVSEVTGGSSILDNITHTSDLATDILNDIEKTENLTENEEKLLKLYLELVEDFGIDLNSLNQNSDPYTEINKKIKLKYHKYKEIYDNSYGEKSGKQIAILGNIISELGIENSKNIINSIITKIKSLKNEIYTLKKSNKELIKKNSTQFNEIKKLKGNNQEHQNLLKKYKEKKEEIDILEGNKKFLENEILILKNEIIKLNKNSNNYKDKLSKLEETLNKDNLVKKTNTLIEKLDELEKINKGLSEQIELLRKENTDISFQKTISDNKNIQSEEKIKQQQQELMESYQNSKRKDEEILEFKKLLEQKEEEIKKLNNIKIIGSRHA